MRTSLILAALLAAAPAFAAAPKKEKPFAPNRPYVEGEVVVQFKEGADSLSAREALEKVDGTVVKVLQKLKLALIQLPAKADAVKAVQILRRQPGVATAEPNYIVSPVKMKPAPRKAPAKKPASAPKKKA